MKSEPTKEQVERARETAMEIITEVISRQFTSGHDAVVSSIAEKLAAFAQAESPAHDLRNCPAMRALERLTPGGSEYIDDIPRCVAAVRDSRDSLMRVLVATKKQLHAQAESPEPAAPVSPPPIQILQDALELLALDEEECGCEHDTDDCCVKQGVFCHRCVSEAALRKSGVKRTDWKVKDEDR